MSSYENIAENEDTGNLDEAIATYISLGTTYVDMVRLLHENEGVDISLTMLKRRISLLKVQRKKKFKMKSAKSNLKRAMRRLQREAGVQTDASKSARLLMSRCGFKGSAQEIRSEQPNQPVVESESNCEVQILGTGVITLLGPNYIWEVASYDQLSSFGFTVSGCVDKFSCKIMWLELMTSDHKDPDIIMCYYLDAVETAGGCPYYMKSELEIENGMMSTAHCSLRRRPEGRYM